jgi:lipopolysaccharide/colanic/teichoic acid biosynthesis glycosyltransferase
MENNRTGADSGEFERAQIVIDKIGWELDDWINDRVLITYTGNMGSVHDWKTLAISLEKIFKSSLKKKVACLVAASGSGASYIKEHLKMFSDSEIRFLEPLDDESWAFLMARSDISLVSLCKEAAHTSIPSKTFSAMAAENAIAAVAPRESDLYRVVKENKCGIVVESGDVNGLVEAIKKLVNSSSQRKKFKKASLIAVKNKYQLHVLARKWDDLAKEICEDKIIIEDLIVKRIFDIFASGLGLVAMSPVMIFACVAIRYKMGSPVFFKQIRPGRSEKPFELIKFRTMDNRPESEQIGVPDKERITTLGKILREMSIDELPTLLNVFKGDMSLVGPRPLLMRYLPYFTERERKRFNVRPGITGWAQVNGRSNLPWNQRLEKDVWYVENRSLLLDFKILCLTALKVFKRENIHFVPTEGFMYDLDVERQNYKRSYNEQ